MTFRYMEEVANISACTIPQYFFFSQSNRDNYLSFDADYSFIILATLPRAWARAHGFGHLCNKAVGGEDDVGPHVSTPAVARDMLSIIDAEHREAGLEGKAKLWYWGFSYGSVLGQTFVSERTLLL
jgi:hypothetical protein